ncbi:hypothetical protein Hanom_Chr05g00408101 [Helianthus anomalus]
MRCGMVNDLKSLTFAYGDVTLMLPVSLRTNLILAVKKLFSLDMHIRLVIISIILLKIEFSLSVEEHS